MRHTHRLRLTPLALALLVASTATMAQGTQPEEESLPAEARQRLDYGIGMWESETHYLDAEGNLRKTSRSEDTRKFIIDDRVVEITGIIDDGASTFRAWEYYDVATGKYTLTSIDRKGRLVTMKGDLDPTFSWTASLTSRDGTPFLMRFTHTDIAENSFTAHGEISRDGGTTWRPFTRQYLKRIEE